MKTVFVLAMLLSSVAQSATYYSINGKLVGQGAAEEAIRKDPKVRVIKVQATQVVLNDQTGNFKKLNDITVEELKAAVK